MDSENPDSLKPTKTDYAYAALTGSLPSYISSFFDLVVGSPLSKRRDKFLKELYEDIQKLKDKVKNIDEEKLKENELFHTIVYNATRIVISTHQKEKIGRLKNIVLNTISGIDINDSEQILFLNYIDRMLPLHVELLMFFQSPRNYCPDKIKDFEAYISLSLDKVISRLFPETEDVILEQLVKELINYGLLSLASEGLKITMTGRGTLETRTTSLGNKFLNFISSPLE